MWRPTSHVHAKEGLEEPLSQSTNEKPAFRIRLIKDAGSPITKTMSAKSTSRMRAKESIAKALFAIAAGTSIFAVLLICTFLFANGIPAMAQIGLPEFIFGTTWRPSNDIYGIFPMIIGSIYVTAGALIVGVPTGLLCAIFLSRFAKGKPAAFLKASVELLAGIPSVIYGFFGLMVIVPFIRDNAPQNGQPVNGLSVLAASVLMGIMILPTVISVAQSALDAVPQKYYEGALALGADRERSVFRIVVPAASSGIMAAVILGLGRAIGETMAVIMVAGNQALIPADILSGVRTMTANIVLEMGYAAGLHRDALVATGVVLFAFILLITMLFNVIKRQGEKE